ncbi:hypothetical protein MMC17_003113 [Xylographa soralifera]|nr:hypothetical protein [Xylographa soralifera]
MDRGVHATALDHSNAKYFPFLDLPVELRMQVYRLILLTLHHYQEERDSYGVATICKRELAILRTCKQIHNEAIEIWRYENTWIHIEIPETAVQLLAFDYIRSSSQRGISLTNTPTLSIRLECPRWKDDKVYTVLEVPESLNIVRWLLIIFHQDSKCFKDLSLCLAVGGRSPASARSLLEIFTSVSGFQRVSIEGDLEEQYMLDIKSRLEEPWKIQDAKDVADLLLERVEDEFGSGCFERALEVISTGGTYYNYVVRLKRNNRLVNDIDMGLTIGTIYTQFALAFIITAFKAQHYKAVCKFYKNLGLVHRLDSFERGWVSCCAAIADVGKKLKVIGGQADLTLESAIESVDNDEDLIVLLRWLNDGIWSDEVLVGHPSYIEYGKLREGYNVWLSIEDEKAAAGLCSVVTADVCSTPWLLATE